MYIRILSIVRGWHVFMGGCGVGGGSCECVSLFTKLNNFRLTLRRLNKKGYIFTSRLGGSLRSLCRVGCPGAPGVRKSVARMSLSGVPPRSVLYTNFPYRPFDRTNEWTAKV